MASPISTLLCQGCLLIFFTNFLGLMIKAGVSDRNNERTETLSVILIIVHVFFFLSIWWNSYASVTAMFSANHIQVSEIGRRRRGRRNLLWPPLPRRRNGFRWKSSRALTSWENRAETPGVTSDYLHGKQVEFPRHGDWSRRHD